MPAGNLLSVPYCLDPASSVDTINLLAVVWTALICTIMVLPPNTRAGLGIAAVILVLFALRRLSGEHKLRRTP